MTLIATLTISGEPRAKARPRHMKGGHSYTPKGTREFEALVAATWDEGPRPDMPACVRLDVDFFLGTHRRVDVDNLVKAIADGLNGRAYDDDWRIHDMRARKFYTSRDRARTEVRVYAIHGDRDEAV